MPVTCPHCSTRYVLPRALLGPGGARVRCPRCREPFVVTPEGDAIPPVVRAAEPATTREATTNDAPAANGAPAGAAASRIEDAVSDPATEPASEVVHAGPPTIVPATSTRTELVGEIEKSQFDAATPSAESTPAATAPEVTAEAAAAPVLTTPLEVARAVLDELAVHSGEAIAASRAEGRLFREFGAVIAEAYEFYRRQVGPGIDAAPFRAALKEKWGIDLDPAHPAGRLG